jgi:hypothetical protein
MECRLFLPFTYQGTNNSTKVEDHPEGGDITSLSLLRRIGHHNGTLGSPKHTSANTKKSTSEDDEAGVLIVGVREERCNVNTVTDTSKSEGKTETESIGDGTGEEGDNSEGAVQGGVGLGGGRGVLQTHTSHAAEGVEHTGAEEAHHGNHEELHAGRRIPMLLAEDAEALVLPAGRSPEIVVMMSRLGGRGRRSLFIRHTPE